MSVFKKLKGTFQSAQQDIVDGLRALTSLESQPRHEQVRLVKAREISLDAGADILYSYQKIWETIQSETKDTARKAEDVNHYLMPMFKIWDQHAETITQLEEEVKAVPSILSTLDKLHSVLESLRQDFAVAEKSIDMLENLCEEQELKKRCFEEQRKLAMYRAQKEAEAERVKVVLAHTHAKKMSELESTQRINLQERAEAFTSAFQEDVDYYKTHGHPDRMPTEFPKVTSLSEIELEEDKQALDNFLGPSGADGESDKTEVEKFELGGEESYIEDDYITSGFSIKQDVDFIEDGDYIDSLKIAGIENYECEDDDEDCDDKSAAKAISGSETTNSSVNTQGEKNVTVKGNETILPSKTESDKDSSVEESDVQVNPDVSTETGTPSKDSGIDDAGSVISSS